MVWDWLWPGLGEKASHGRAEGLEVVEPESSATGQMLDAARERFQRRPRVATQLEHESLLRGKLGWCFHGFPAPRVADACQVDPDIWLVFFGYFSDSPFSAP